MVELEGIPKAYLSAILNILVRYGVIVSRRGPSGGYVLARNPSEITLARVVEVLRRVRERLGAPGASRRAAEIIMRIAGERVADPSA